MLSFSIKRSPAKVCWWVCCNGNMVTTADTKQEAEEIMSKLSAKYL